MKDLSNYTTNLDFEFASLSRFVELYYMLKQIKSKYILFQKGRLK